ncbi:unnamed protein product [Aphanomyces euteiches]
MLSERGAFVRLMLLWDLDYNSGLYKFCFVHRGTSSKLAVFVNIEFLTATDRSLTIYPTTALTVTPLGNKFDRLDLDVRILLRFDHFVHVSGATDQRMSLALLANNATMRYLLALMVQCDISLDI